MNFKKTDSELLCKVYKCNLIYLKGRKLPFKQIKNLNKNFCQSDGYS